ncbi:valine--tRNA ligase [Candidatus Acetothermia bacterium]|nr:valine--tRNA ligase [Candidatus Acetothermia bacterium]MCI2426884.1 valine--tRNA ligase [Candidatus Acetothermia bacterium]MCI2428628.1 valine--tRNA ligase [Candidatus Acetothermia bacterium]
MELPKRYDPTEVEDKIYSFWEEQALFDADIDWDKEPFTMVIPPPNITSVMHIGNALIYTLHDVLIRYKRMDGYVACWFPGMDHAGIATQNVVERRLATENCTRHDLGREKFVERVWEWKREYGGQIQRQMKALGTSPDWRRERFTLDDDLSMAVCAAFVRLYNEGYIYRDKRLINWCPRCQTAISDIEVIHHEIDGNLYYIRYALQNSADYITITTTRPETMLGDSAIAVNPYDQQKKSLLGKIAILPILERELPIVDAVEVDPKFGTGILKITPAHDPLDFEIGKRHNLPQINIFTNDANLNENAGPYAGLDRYAARKQIVVDLKACGRIEKIIPYRHAIGHCQRCDTLIEPLISMQWFVAMADLAAPAIEVVRTDTIKFIPSRWKSLYFDWLEKIKDWCISRQLWWGHRIPAWYCADCKEITVAIAPPQRCSACQSSKIEQETDVLDTWFSSALWPISVMGWPQQTEELKYFYPTSLLITGFDIIFFWVARMIMMGLYFQGIIPFKEVYFTPLVEDEHGVKMSSSRGNIIDPLEIKERYGMDALRFSLTQASSKGRGIRIAMRDIEASRNFLNKVWNMARFILLEIGDDRPNELPQLVEIEDRWIISQLAKTTELVRNYFASYSFNQAADTIYDFVWHQCCDWYLEIVKQRLNEADNKDAVAVIYYLLQEILKLLHPFVPFITEEIWQRINNRRSPIAIAHFPCADHNQIDREAEKLVELFQRMVTAVRRVRAELRIPQQALIQVLISTENKMINTMMEKKSRVFSALVGADYVKIDQRITPPANAAKQIVDEAEIFIPLTGLIDITKERARLEGVLTKISKELYALQKRLNNQAFRVNAPAEIIAKEESRAAEYTAMEAQLQAYIVALKEK